ncbi:hypothetical protein ACTXT7_003864 [Hymenolepis weldensis]
MNLMQFMESPMPQVIPVRLFTKSTVSKQQSVPTSCLLDHQTNQIYHLKGQKKGCCTSASTRAYTAFAMIKSSKFISQCTERRLMLISAIAKSSFLVKYSTEIYLGAFDSPLSWNLETSETQCNHQLNPSSVYFKRYGTQ